MPRREPTPSPAASPQAALWRLLDLSESNYEPVDAVIAAQTAPQLLILVGVLIFVLINRYRMLVVGPTHINTPTLFTPLGPGFALEEEEAVQRLGASADFVQLVNAVADGYLLFAVVDSEEERQVLTVEYEVPMPDPKDVNPKGFRGFRIGFAQRIGWTPLPFKLETGSDYATASTHVDISALEGLSFGRRELDPGHAPNEPRHRIFHRGTTLGGVRFRFTQRPGKRGSYVAFHVHPGDSAMLRGWMAGAAILAILGYGLYRGASAMPYEWQWGRVVPFLFDGNLQRLTWTDGGCVRHPV